MHFSGAALAFAVALMAAATPPAAAQLPSCTSKLAGCANYLNATTAPPSTCCGPLNSAVKNELPCLCSLFNNAEVMKAFNVNMIQALNVAKLCGTDADADPATACAAASGSGTPAAGTPPSSSSNSSGSGSPSRKSENSAHGMTSVGFSGLLSFLLLFSCLSVLA